MAYARHESCNIAELVYSASEFWFGPPVVALQGICPLLFVSVISILLSSVSHKVSVYQALSLLPSNCTFSPFPWYSLVQLSSFLTLTNASELPARSLPSTIIHSAARFRSIPNIWIVECCATPDKCVLTCGSCIEGRVSQVALRSSVPRSEAKAPAHSLSGCGACLLLKQAAPHGLLSCRFYRERNKVLCSEESGRTLVLNPSQLLFVWVLWVEMRRKMRQCVSHLGIDQNSYFIWNEAFFRIQ